MKASLKLFNLVLIAGALVATGLRAQTIGGAAPQAKPKKFTFGFGYAYQQGSYEETSSRWVDWSNGAIADTGVLDDRVEIMQRRLYLEGGYAFTKNMELIARVGLNYADPEGVKNNYKNASFGGLTYRWRLHDGEKLDIGVVINGNWSATVERKDVLSYSYTDTTTTPSTTYTTAFNVETSVEGLRDGLVAVPFEMKAGERMSFYLAPAYVRAAGRVRDLIDSTYTVTSGTTTVTTYTAPMEYRAHITRRTEAGGYFGMRFGDNDWQFNVEGAYVNGTSISFGFRRAF